MGSGTTVYLKRPRMTASFSVTVVSDGERAARLEGVDVGRVLVFLQLAHGVPVFDIEYDSRLWSNCHLIGNVQGNSIPFTVDSVSEVGPATRSPPE